MTQDNHEDQNQRRTIKRIEPTQAMRKRLSDSFRDMIAGYPFLASIAASSSVFYHFVDDPKLPVAMTDGQGIYFNATAGGWADTKTFSLDEAVFIHAHEVLHILREDPAWNAINHESETVAVPRTPACPDGRLPYKDDVMQRACDCIINATLIADKVGKPPAETLTDPKITPMMSRGEAYALLYEKEEKQQQQDGNKGGGGGGAGQGNPDPLAGDQMMPGDMGDPEGDASDESSRPRDRGEATRHLQDTAPERQVAAQRASSAARMAGVGSTMAEEMTLASQQPGIDWRSYFQGFLARAAGNSAYDWRRPSRPPLVRELMGDQPFFTPSRGGHGVNHLMFVGDTSGSIQELEHRAMLASMCEMARELNPRFVSVVWCDDEVQRIDVHAGVPGEEGLEEFYNINPIPRGGGTSFVPPFEMVESLRLGGTGGIPDNMPSHMLADLMDAGVPDGLTYFTDLYGAWPEEAPTFPVLWLVTTDKEHPWGDRVTVDPQELVDR